MGSKSWFSLRTAVFSGGERYPLLVDERGVPLWYTNLFVTTQVRNAAKASQTQRAVLAAIRMVLVWADEQGMDLENRFVRKWFLGESELESLRRYTQAKADYPQKPFKAVPLPRKKEGVRPKLQAQEPRVSGATQYIRLTYIADYLEWLAKRLLEREARQITADDTKAIQRMSEGLRARRPLKKGRNAVRQQRGLIPEQREVLFELVEPGSERNPFRPEVQQRNCLIVSMLYHLGMRHGELLGIRIGKDLDLMKNTLLIARRHDDPEDPRTNQPVAKTRDREVPLSPALAEQIQDYILYSRRSVPGAKRHDFLVVTHQKGPHQGAPLSSKGLTKVFDQLRDAEPERLANLVPHALRHDWNERFSDKVEEEGWPEAKEEKARSYHNGWKPNSGTAAIYTKRYTERKAREAALSLQRMSKEDPDE